MGLAPAIFEEVKLDLVIRGGRVIDPLTDLDEVLNIGIENDKISVLTREELRANRTLDASGLVVSPGFIDMHTHDEERDDSSTQECLLRQGVTTILSGNCGSGKTGFTEEKELRSKLGTYVNFMGLIGHMVLRETVGINDRYRPADERENEQMEVLLRMNLKAGAKGVSFGLEYCPGTSQVEIIRLLMVLKEFKDSLASAHVRYDGPKVLKALSEMLKAARTTGVPLQVSHLGSMASFGIMGEALKTLEEASKEGVDVKADCYPYSAFATHLGTAVFDPGFEERWGKGLEALEIASGSHKGEAFTEKLFHHLRAEEPETIVIAHVMREDEVWRCLQHPLVMLGSDAGFHHGEGHPRGAGAFPRVIRIMVREKRIIKLREMLIKMTCQPAERLKIIESRGRIAPGMFADLVVFNPDTIKDEATFKEPTLPPSGIKWVVINGKVVVEDGKLTGVKAGRHIITYGGK